MANRFNRKRPEKATQAPMDPAAGANTYRDSAAEGALDPESLPLAEALGDPMGVPDLPEPLPSANPLAPDVLAEEQEGNAPGELLTEAPNSEAAPQAGATHNALSPDASPDFPGAAVRANAPPNTASAGAPSDFPGAAVKANTPTDEGQSTTTAAPNNNDATEKESKMARRLTALGRAILAFWEWLIRKIKAIPPIDDIFDQIIFSLGLRRKPASMLKRAGTLAHKGRLAEAVSFYREYQALRPLSVAGYDGLGRAFFRMGLSEEANREFSIADSMERIIHNRDDLEAAATLAIAFLERKQVKISVSLIEPVLIAHFYTPSNSDLLKAMGKVYEELRTNKKLHQVYSAGLAQHPGDYEFHILKGQAEIKLGNIAEGERLVRWGRLMKKLRENPKDPQAKMAMGEIYLKEEKQEDGLRCLREAADELPQNTGVRWRLFNLYQKQENYKEALKYFLEIVELDPENDDLRYRLADFYRRHQNRDAALEIYRRFCLKYPRDPKPHLQLGDLLVETGAFDEGQKMKDLAQTLEIGLKKDPDHRETIRFMNYLFETRQTKEAYKWLETGLAKWPYHGELIMTKVKRLYKEYRYKEAVDLLKRLISVKPDMAEPHIWIAQNYQRLGDNMAALAEAQLATRLAPKSYTAHKVLGDVLKEQKKLSQANAAYEVAEMMRNTAKR